VLNILLLGRNGQVGWELQRTLAPLGKVVATGTSGGPLDANLENFDSLARAVREVRPRLIVNAGAYTAVDRAAMFLALLGVSTPTFVLAPLLILAFAIGLGVVPVSGRAGPASLVLPALTLGVGMAAILSRMVRSSLLEVLRQDFIVMAFATTALTAPVVAALGWPPGRARQPRGT